MALIYLKHILLKILSSPLMKAQGQLLSISNHLDMIHSSLWAIRAVIVDGELQNSYMELLKKKQQQLKEEMFVENPELEDWVKGVDLAIVDAEEILNKILHWKPMIAKASDNLSPCSFLYDANKALFRHSILIELKKVGHELSYLGRRGSALGLRWEMLDSMHPLQDDEYADILTNEVVGRDTDKNSLIQLMKQQPNNSSDDYTTSIIVIERSYRAEKKMLARMIYHDRWVREYFKYKIWVDAFFLRDPGSIGIAREIVRSIGGGESLLTDNVDWSTVKRLLCNDKYLLILTDYDNSSSTLDLWMELKRNLLHLGGRGSAVIVTTDSPDQFYDQKNIRIYPLGGISKDAWKELLVKQQHAQNSDEDDDESLIDDHLRCARVAGAIVRSTRKNGWNNQDAMCPDFSLKSQLLPFIELFDDADMDQTIHEFLFSSLFSTNFTLNRQDLLLLLEANNMPEGSFSRTAIYKRSMVKSSGLLDKYSISLIERKQWSFQLRMGKDETIPEQCIYLCLLLGSHASKLLFPRKILSARITQKLKVLIIRSEGRTEDKIFLGDRILEVTLQLFKRLKSLRALFIESIGIKQIPKILKKLQSLRYLKLFEIEIIKLPESLCNLLNLQILQLDYCEELQKLPMHIDKLFNLKYLYLTYCTKLQKLPESISALVNLEILDIEGCHWLTELPKDLANLKKLRLIDMSECASLTRMPLNIRQMTQLECLFGVVAADNDNVSLATRYVIPELQSLTNLTRLKLRNLERASKQEEGIQLITLENKGRLEILALHWEYWNMDEDIIDAASLQVIEALKPNPNHLNFLEIISYPSKDFPSWIKQGVSLYHLNYLWEIKLINLKRCKKLPPLGSLAYLRVIYISGMDLVSSIDDSFYGDEGIFPSLKSLTLCEMSALEEWQVPKRENRVHPLLEELRLIQCPKFMQLNASIGISKLHIWLNNEILWAPNSVLWDNFNSVESMKIVGCQELRCFPLDLEQLEQLRALTIISCNKLKIVPDWFLRFKNLNLLQISGCEMLSYIPQELQSRSYFEHAIEGCPKLRL